MRYILTFLSLFMIANIVAAQSSKMVYLNSDSSKISIYFDTAKSSVLTPLYIVNGKSLPDAANQLDANDIKSIYVKNNDTIVDNKSYRGVVYIDVKKISNINANKYLLSSIITDSLHLNTNSVICSLDDQIINTAFDQYYFDFSHISNIVVVPYRNVLNDSKIQIWLVKLFTRSNKKLDGNSRIILRGGPITASN
jgi:hypothetical protein